MGGCYPHAWVLWSALAGFVAGEEEHEVGDFLGLAVAGEGHCRDQLVVAAGSSVEVLPILGVDTAPGWTELPAICAVASSIAALRVMPRMANFPAL